MSWKLIGRNKISSAGEGRRNNWRLRAKAVRRIVWDVCTQECGVRAECQRSGKWGLIPDVKDLWLGKTRGKPHPYWPELSAPTLESLVLAGGMQKWPEPIL